MPKKKKSEPKGRFCPILRKMLDEEFDADEEYRSLALSAKDRKTRKAILRIQKDERKHFKVLKKILDEKCR